MSKKRNRLAKKKFSSIWAVWVGGLAALLGALALMVTQQSVAADVVVYKSPTCGCCGKWIDHMEQAGFVVDVKNRGNLGPIKAEYGVPRHLQSCHTAEVGGYLVEGHVPPDLIQRMLDEKPDIRGLAVPGMPMGSPGMEGPYKDEYDVLAIGKDGRTKVYARR
jgi:hypothetical protein